MEPAVWGFIGTAIGALASIATTSISNWNSFRIQKALSKEEREERARAFQRETVLELQEELIGYIRLFALSYFEQLDSYESTGKWGALLTEELDEKIRLSDAKTTVLIERIMKDEIRAQLDELKAIIWNGIIANSKKEADSYQLQASRKFDECNKVLGNVLRKNY